MRLVRSRLTASIQKVNFIYLNSAKFLNGKESIFEEKSAHVAQSNRKLANLFVVRL